METENNSEQIQPLTEEQVVVKAEKSVKSFFKHAIKFGGIFSLIFIALALVYYIANINFFTNFAYMLISFLVNIIIISIAMVIGINKYRDGFLGGSINFGRCFLMGLTIGFFTFILSGVFSLLFNNLFDPEYISKQVSEMMQGLSEKGVTEDQIAVIQEKMEANLKLAPQLLGVLTNSIIFSAVISLIVSAFIRKKDKALIEEGIM
jgi:hypothetical protein